MICSIKIVSIDAIAIHICNEELIVTTEAIASASETVEFIGTCLLEHHYTSKVIRVIELPGNSIESVVFPEQPVKLTKSNFLHALVLLEIKFLLVVVVLKNVLQKLHLVGTIELSIEAEHCTHSAVAFISSIELTLKVLFEIGAAPDLLDKIVLEVVAVEGKLLNGLNGDDHVLCHNCYSFISSTLKIMTNRDSYNSYHLNVVTLRGMFLLKHGRML